MRLLIVDDEPSILELLGVALRALGSYKVKTATSARQALEMIADKPREFDAFLLDIQMPGMDGIELCSEIRRNQHYRSAPILMLTAMSQMSYVEKAFEAGATDYVTKPFNFDDLKSRLNTARKQKYSKAATNSAEATPSMMRSVFNNDHQDYSEELDFSKVERFIGSTEFENYVRQMTLAKAPHICAFAVRVANGANIAASAASMDFYNLFHRVASAISAGTSAAGSLLAYRGNGLFICAEHGMRRTDTTKLEADIAAEMARIGGNTEVAQIAVGLHVDMETFDAQAGKRLIDAAIARAEARTPAVVQTRTPEPPRAAPVAETLPEMPRVVPVRYEQRAERPAAPRQRPDRRAYEQMLLDSLRNV
ncbi:response regulator [Oceanicola sp. 22II-s10i]|uniref:response regulator n=1 Tax=Oceanicola sp. 22II-s10i TaxID=1317116 RepID=UPI001596035B|nr:response regulator [Oceanicola sp. 22II-s10i]